MEPRNQASGLGGLDRVRLRHEALPELDFADIRLNAPCLGNPLATPFFVSGMTAGHAEAGRLNARLALACEGRGWAMGVGSQRRDLELGASPDLWASLRRAHPRLFLLANLGVSQAISADLSSVRRLVEGLGAQALVLHANALQEALQPEGTPRFRGGLEAVSRLVRGLSVPVVLKETGCGFSSLTLKRIAETGVGAVDVSGLGGTHWGRIEGARAGGADPIREGAAETFAEWGIPTAQSVLEAGATLPAGVEVWGSGGVRSGLDAAKLIALGAHRVGYAQPAMRAALEGDEALDSWMERMEFELRLALFCTGSLGPEALRLKEGVWAASS